VAQTDRKSERGRFTIFRAKDARCDADTTIMQYEPVSAVVAEGSRKAQAEGVDDGHDLRVLFSAPGVSLVYVWFKSGFPLPRHSHNVDCLYYIVGGSLTIGHTELGVGDGFFVGRDVPYAYIPGPAGVEVLEFRAADQFNIKVMADNPAFWDKAAEAVRSHRDAWVQESRPAGMVPEKMP
jgi:hypothetical protein